LQRLLREMPDLAADLDVPARGSAHAPSRKASLLLSFRGAAKGREPGIHNHKPAEYGFRVRSLRERPGMTVEY